MNEDELETYLFRRQTFQGTFFQDEVDDQEESHDTDVAVTFTNLSLQTSC